MISYLVYVIFFVGAIILATHWAEAWSAFQHLMPVVQAAIIGGIALILASAVWRGH